MLNTAIKAARRAATVINRASFDLDRITISEKNHNDFVTDIDQASEQVWIIDPIDGTTNFMHGYPNYCVSIALQQRGVITQAVVYDPVRNDLYTATKGAGAYLNEKRIRVRNPDRINKTLIGSGHGADPRALAEYLRMYEVVAQRCQGVRSSGSAALELANVAAGRIDGYYEKGLKIWDIAAGSLLVTEAGGIVGEFSGESEYLNKGDIIAAGPKVFAGMVALLKPFA
jgi:myo-inositol-1(or 4)-monophosphatase